MHKSSPQKNKRTLVIIILILLILQPLAAESFTAEVLKVVDGDTIYVRGEESVLKLRLWGIDTPERNQPWGAEAADYVRSLAGRQFIKAEVLGIDRYERFVVIVTLPDGNILNEELISAGLAWWYRRYAPDAAHLKALEEDARADGRGLWSRPGPVAPWDWRRGVRTPEKEASGM